jgi:hypothetical protein
MLLPRLQANPTKVVLALGAFDMIAAFVLLYGRIAVVIRTTFRIGHEPKIVCRQFLFLVRIAQLFGFDFDYFLKPVFPIFTSGWLMAFLQTIPTKVMTISAIDRFEAFALLLAFSC